MAGEAYIPDEQYYSRQIKELEKSRTEWTQASYDSARRAYVIGKETYTKAEVDAAVAKIDTQIKDLKAAEKKYGKYGPSYGEAAQGNAAGEQFMQLYNAAQSINVTDFDSAIRSLDAWRAVDQFLAANPDTLVVAQREAIVGRYRRTIPVVVNPLHDSNFVEELTPSVNNAYQKATQMAEVGTTEERTLIKGKGAAATRSTQKVVTNQAELDRRLKILDETAPEVRQTGTMTPTTTPSTTTPTTTPSTATTVPKESALTTTTTVAKKTPKMGGGARGGTAAEIAAYQAAQKKPDVAGPVTPGVASGVAAGKVPPTQKKQLAWEKVAAKFRQMFPGQSWVLDIDPAKYPDVQNLIRKAQQQNLTAERFAEEWKNTSFYKEVASKGIVRQITQLVGDVGFDSKPLNAFVTQAMNMGWSGDTLRFEAYTEAFRKDNTGAFVNPTAVDRIKKSNDYLQVASIGKQYFNQVADDTVQQVLTGNMTQDDVSRQQRELAKARYAHLAPLIDQGLTLEAIGDNYKTQAAQLLEKDANSIDMSQADYEVALNFGDPGQKRLMTQGEWQRLLRTDSKYGWTRTENAKQEARQLVENMNRVFGRVM